MKKLIVYSLTFVGVIVYLFLIWGSASQQPVVKVDYSPVYVPQESGYKFLKISDDLDGINAFTSDFGSKWNDISDKVFDISKDESLIIFQSILMKNGVKEANYYLRNLSNLKIKQQRTFQKFTSDGCLSRDNKWICYEENRNSQVDLFLVGAETGAKIQQITNTPSYTCNPVFSPDNKRILYTEYEKIGEHYNAPTQKYIADYETFLWSYDLEKGTLIQYGKGFLADFFPDGKQVVCVRTGKKNELWILNLETGQEYTLLSNDTKGYSQPAVSPDGKKVAFVGVSSINNKSNFDLFVINADGTGLTQITFHPGNDYNPKWSKDGKSLYFTSQRGSISGIHNIWKITIE